MSDQLWQRTSNESSVCACRAANIVLNDRKHRMAILFSKSYLCLCMHMYTYIHERCRSVATASCLLFEFCHNNI